MLSTMPESTEEITDRTTLALALALKEQERVCQAERKKGVATPWDSRNKGEEGSGVS